jgi:hypothetical protein
LLSDTYSSFRFEAAAKLSFCAQPPFQFSNKARREQREFSRKGRRPSGAECGPVYRTPTAAGIGADTRCGSVTAKIHSITEQPGHSAPVRPFALIAVVGAFDRTSRYMVLDVRYVPNSD